VPAGESRPSVGTVVPVVPNHVCPVVNSFEELVVTDSEGTMLDRWPVAARGLLS
jgi:D-serine deaminase-like pyridoxal phosphate-dependent protein